MSLVVAHPPELGKLTYDPPPLPPVRRFLSDDYKPKPHNSYIMRCKTKANENTLKLQAIKDKIAEHEESLLPENTDKLRTGLSCHHNFNSDKSHEIKSGVEKDVDLVIEDLNRVSAKYWATGYKIGSKSKPTESRKKK